MKDFGYDVSDYCDVDPVFGDLAAFDALVAGAHQRGLRLIIDQVWSHIGSTNLDNRSFESNDEISLGIMDEGLTAELRSAFLDDLKSCEQILYEPWSARAASHKLRDWASYRLNEFL